MSKPYAHNIKTLPWREHLDAEEAADLVAIDAHLKWLRGQRQRASGRRQEIVNRAIARAKLAAQRAARAKDSTRATAPKLRREAARP